MYYEHKIRNVYSVRRITENSEKSNAKRSRRRFFWQLSTLAERALQTTKKDEINLLLTEIRFLKNVQGYTERDKKINLDIRRNPTDKKKIKRK